MEVLSDGFLKFNSNTLKAVRQEIGLDKPKVLNQAINDLEQWVSEQAHFVKKDISRQQLERILIAAKGSIDKAKSRIDKSCTAKTLLPEFFQTYDARVDIEPYDNLLTFAVLPQLTKKHERVIIVRNLNYCGAANFTEACQYFVKILEYLKVHDYSAGLILIIDYEHINLKNVLSKLNLDETRRMASIVIDCYGFRKKQVYIISKSSMIGSFVSFVKQIVPAKLAKRVQVIKHYKLLYKEIPKEMLPEEFEGPERCIDDLHDDLLKVLSSETMVEHFKESSKACTNEALRSSSDFNSAYIGAPGSLQRISID